MGDELVFTVDAATATPASAITLSEAGLREREHLQEWVKAHPQILGEDLLLITDEFDRWQTAAGRATYERLDVLALDRTGRLVVGELKRDRAPDTVALQALTYAAMVSRFSVDDLAELYAAKQDCDTAGALTTLLDWAPELADDTLAPPRIVVVAGAFGPVLTNTALFLYENGIDIRLVRVSLFKTGNGQLLFSASQILPVPRAEDFMVRPKSGPATGGPARQARQRRASIPDLLVAHRVLADEQALTIVVSEGVKEDRNTINSWLQDDPARAQVRWHNDPRAPFRWPFDGRTYSMAGLIRELIQQATGEQPTTDVWGPNWVRTNDGTTLAKLADPLP